MGVDILREEAAAFRRASESVAVFEPRHRTEGVFTGRRLNVDGTSAVDLSGLDYLALGSDETIKESISASLAENDTGIPGSEAVIKMAQSHDLEDSLARFHLGEGAAITFTAGYAANFSLMEALGLRTNSHFIRMHRAEFRGQRTAEIPTLFFMDENLHFSLRHGIRFARRLSPEGCAAQTYLSGDTDHLDKLLRQSVQTHGDRAVRVILTDTLDSATGQEADMLGLCQLAETYDCLLYADEAHAVGVLGPRGRGVTANLRDFDRYRDRLLIMGTLTKAFCQPGGYIAMSDPELASMLRFSSPQHVFSAPISPWVASATVRVLDLLAGDFGERRRQAVRRISRYARTRLRAAGFEVTGRDDVPIIAVPLRAPRSATRILDHLREWGFLVSVFQAPLMPMGEEVLRLAMRADIDEETVDRLVTAMVACRGRMPSF